MYKKTFTETYNVSIPISDLEYSFEPNYVNFENYLEDIAVLEQFFGHEITVGILMYSLAKAQDYASSNFNKHLFTFVHQSNKNDVTVYCTLKKSECGVYVEYVWSNCTEEESVD